MLVISMIDNLNDTRDIVAISLLYSTMNFLPSIQNEYEYSLRKYKPKNIIDDCILSEMDVIKAHFVLADYFVRKGEMARYGVLNYDMLSSAISRQNVGFGGKLKWTDDFCKIATLTFGLTKDHAFNDGNKRTALLCMLKALHITKRMLTCKKKEIETLLVRIAANQMNQYKDFKKFEKRYKNDAIVYFIANYLRKNSRKIDNTFRTLTFVELNRKLKNYGIWLDNPIGCYIDVMHNKETTKLFGLLKNSKPQKIMKIGFPGWKKQVNPKALKSILSTSGLTSLGIDLKTFYDETEPEYQLIDDYYTVLKRLMVD